MVTLNYIHIYLPIGWAFDKVFEKRRLSSYEGPGVKKTLQ